MLLRVVLEWQNTFGAEEYDVKVSIILRIGDNIVFSDLTLAQALAGVGQMYFCFNLLYPPEVADSLQFLERIVCCFGSQDGARNKKNGIRKGFREFEVIHFMLDLILIKIYIRGMLQRFCWNLMRVRSSQSSTDVGYLMPSFISQTGFSIQISERGGISPEGGGMARDANATI